MPGKKRMSPAAQCRTPHVWAGIFAAYVAKRGEFITPDAQQKLAALFADCMRAQQQRERRRMERTAA